MPLETILCVDDDSSVLNALRTLFARRLQGTQTIEIAESGEEALELLAEIEHDGGELAVVIADYIMPGMKGDELLVQIHARIPNAVKIMLTGQSDMHGVKRAINEANLFRFLEKPWQNDDIVLTLQAALKTYCLDRELQRYVHELQRMNEELEATVAKRTQELQDKNKELERLSVTDRLTGLYNRLFVDRVLTQELAAANRGDSIFSVILIDLDHFKSVNDSYGHGAGDAVLTVIADTLQHRVRDSDIVARWGGEEFLVVCPNTPHAGAVEIAEALRSRVERVDFPFVGHCTASLGVASYAHGDSIVSLVARADAALYEAKKMGRNRVISTMQVG